MITRVKLSSWHTQDSLGYVDIIDTGCVGDGTTDNSAAFAVALAIGLPIYIPVGTFIIGPVTLAANSTLFGPGTLKLKTASTGALLTLGSGTLIENVTLDGNKANVFGTTYHTLSIVNAVETIVRNVKCQSVAGDGININGTATEGVTVSGCSATNFTGNGFTWAAGNDVRFMNCKAYSSDTTAVPGDGFAIASTGNSVSNGALVGCVAKSNSGRGFSFIGNGSKNVTGIAVSGCIAKSNISHGFHTLTAQRVLLDTCIATNNSGDGFRMEGDTQNCRLTNSGAFSNNAFGIRELTNVSTPNNNGFVYDMASGNSSDTITKVGASSFIYSS